MNDQRRITEHFGPPTNSFVSRDQETFRSVDQQYEREMTATSRAIAERDAAYVQALSGIPPKREQLQLREPMLPSGFADALIRFDDEIRARGIAVNRNKLLALGAQRFNELLACDRAARTEQRVVGPAVDLTSWWSTHQALANMGLNAGIPRQKTVEAWRGTGDDRQQAGRFAGFFDLWKSATEPRAVKFISVFRDKFESLLLGLSLLDRIGDDGKVRSTFFSSGLPAGRFSDWLSVLEQPQRVIVTLLDPVGDLVGWLANEPTPAPRPLEFAKHLFGVRAPSPEQIKIARALWHAFVLGYVSPWGMFDFVGRQSRVRTEPATLEIWRRALAKQYPRIEYFVGMVREHFYRPVEGQQFRFDEAAHRHFVDANIRRLVNQLSAIVGMAVEEDLPNSIVARFENSIMASVTDRPQIEAHIVSKLQAAFPHSNFQLHFES